MKLHRTDMEPLKYSCDEKVEWIFLDAREILLTIMNIKSNCSLGKKLTKKSNGHWGVGIRHPKMGPRQSDCNSFLLVSMKEGTDRKQDISKF